MEEDWSILHKSWQSGLHISRNYLHVNIMCRFTVVHKVNVYRNDSKFQPRDAFESKRISIVSHLLWPERSHHPLHHCLP